MEVNARLDEARSAPLGLAKVLEPFFVFKIGGNTHIFNVLCDLIRNESFMLAVIVLKILGGLVAFALYSAQGLHGCL